MTVTKWAIVAIKLMTNRRDTDKRMERGEKSVLKEDRHQILEKLFNRENTERTGEESICGQLSYE